MLATSIAAATPAARISKLCAINWDGITDADGDHSDWLELENTTSAPLALDGWYLSDDRARPMKWRLPARTIAPGATLRIFASGKDRRGEELHTNFRLARSGDDVILARPDGTIADQLLAYPPQLPDLPHGSIRAAEPTASIPSGPITKGRKLALSTEQRGDRIYYTRDGSLPDETSTLYTTPIVLEATTIIRARTHRDDRPPSRVALFTYFVTGEHPNALAKLPLISIAAGPRADLSSKREHRASFELLLPDQPSIDLEAALEGHGSNQEKRSLRVSFTGRYGEGALRAKLFEGGAERIDRLVLRAGNNDSPAGTLRAKATFLRDRWVRDTQLAMSGIGVRGAFVHLFLDGRYWGLYEAVEVPDRRYASAYFGGDEELWTQIDHRLERGGSGVEGDRRPYDRLESLVGAGAEPIELTELIDLERFADYLILNWYAGVGDGLDNNWFAAIRADPPHPLQFFVWDAEYAFIEAKPNPSSNLGAWVPPAFLRETEEGARFARTLIVRLFRALETKPEFRSIFADRVHRHCLRGALSEDQARRRWRALAGQIAPAIPLEAARWKKLREEDWRAAIDEVDRAIDGNVARFFSALKAHGWPEPAPRSTPERSLLAAAEVALPPPRLDPDSLRRGPRDAIGAGDVVHCAFEKLDTGAKASSKLRCFRTDERGVFYDKDGGLHPEARRVSRAGGKPVLLDASGQKLIAPSGAPIRPDALKLKFSTGRARDAEVYTEVAASRLFWALGFPTDQLQPLGEVRCRGCGPKSFGDAANERGFGERIGERGWSWSEAFQASASWPAPKRAALEALAILVVLVQQANTKSGQHRFVCLDRALASNDAPCDRPLLLIADLGAAFADRNFEPQGERDKPRGSLALYRKARVFRDARTCELGAPLIDGRPVRAGEAGRSFLAERLESIHREHLQAIVEVSELARASRANPEDAALIAALKGGDAELTSLWVDALEQKIEEVRSARCPDR